MFPRRLITPRIVVPLSCPPRTEPTSTWIEIDTAYADSSLEHIGLHTTRHKGPDDDGSHHRYLRYRLSYADTAELLAERGICVDPSTIYAWVQRFTPLYHDAARAYRYPVGCTWSVDETYVRVAVRWQYAYRAIDEYGQVVDVYLSETRDAEAAERFFRGALEETGERPTRVTTDKAACYLPALRMVLPEVEHVTGKLIQQRIERDHQHLKGRTRLMRGFKTERGAQIVCRGHGFLRNLSAGFYDLGGTATGTTHHRAARLMQAWGALIGIVRVA